MENSNRKSSFLNDFYYANKILVWVLIIVILFLVGYFLLNKNRQEEPKDNSEQIEITIKPDDVSEVSIGNSIKLEAEVTNHPQANIIWSTEKESIATVNNGTVTGINYGTTTIVASYYDNDGKSYLAKKIITVSEGKKGVSLQDVEFQEGDLYMPLNSTYKLSLLITPTDAHIENKLFVVGDDNVATVDNNGVVTAKSEGHTRVIVDINNGKFKRAIDVYVGKEYSKANIVISPSSLSFNSDKIKVKVGNSTKLTYNITPSNANRAYLNWISSDEEIVTVDKEGKITAKKSGDAIISVSSLNGKRDDIVVSVLSDVIDVKDIVLSVDSLNMTTGSTQEIVPVVTPSDASNKSLNFIVTDNAVASVSPNSDGTRATISALKAGNTTISIQSSNGIEKYLTIIVTGDDSNSNNTEDEEEYNTDLPTTIKVRSDKNNLAKTYDEVVDIPVAGISMVSVNLSIGVGKIKYCIQRYEVGSYCTPKIEMYSNDSIEVPSGGIYLIRIKKYDYRGNEISSSSNNYVKGALNYYVNTLSSTSGYSIEGAYEEAVDAMNNPVFSKNVQLQIDNSRLNYIKYCATKEVNCTPSTTVYSSKSITLSEDGLYRIIVEEYDKKNNLVEKAKLWYINHVNTNSKVAIIPTASSHCRNVTYMGTGVTLTAPAGEGYYFSDNFKNAPGYYPVTATLQSGYIWSDGTTEVKTIYCTLKSN